MKNQQLFFGAGVLFLFFSFLSIPSSVKDAQTFAGVASTLLTTAMFLTHLDSEYSKNITVLIIRIASTLMWGIFATAVMVFVNGYILHIGDNISFHKMAMFYTDLAIINCLAAYFFQKVEVVRKTK